MKRKYTLRTELDVWSEQDIAKHKTLTPDSLPGAFFADEEASGEFAIVWIDNQPFHATREEFRAATRLWERPSGPSARLLSCL